MPISFAVCAKSAKEAAYRTRHIPRVKHHKKDAIISVKRVSKEKYIQQRNQNDKDWYLKSQNKQEQNLFCKNLENRVVDHVQYTDQEKYKKERAERLVYLAKKRQTEERFNLSF